MLNSATFLSRPQDREALVLSGAYMYVPVWRTNLFRQERTGASATTLCGDGDVVGSIRSLGTAGGWGVAPSDAARPTLRKDGNLWYLDFDGSNDKFDWTISPAITPSELYGAAAFRPATSGIIAYERVLTVTNGANLDYTGDDRAALIARNSSNSLWYGVRSYSGVPDIASTNGVDTTYDTWHTATTINSFMNGTEQSTSFASKGNFSIDYVTLGCHRSGTEYFKSRIYGFVLFTRVPSANERASIRTHIGRWAGLTV